MVGLSIEGRAVEAPASSSILQAVVQAGQTLVDGVGCMGQGVCGSCRVMLRRAGSDEVMCGLCTLACPEHIRPNHLGPFVLQQIESGAMAIDFDAPGARPPG